jgi:hypothetical protein
MLKELRTLTRGESHLRDSAALKIQQVLMLAEKKVARAGSRGGNY